MADPKWKRTIVGSVIKDRDAKKPDYVKFSMDWTIKKGDCFNLSNPKKEIVDVEEKIASGKLSEEIGAKIIERLKNIPDFVRFQIVKVSKE